MFSVGRFLRRLFVNPAEVSGLTFQSATLIREPFSSLSEEEKQFAHKVLADFEKAESRYGNLPRRDLLRPMLLSKNGRHDEAVSLAEQRYRDAPGYEAAVALASAARRAGDLKRAEAMFAKGAEHDPGDLSCFLEIGDLCLEQERCADALKAYERVLAKDDRHQWALPSAFYCRHRLGVEGNWLASLREVALQEGCTCGLEGCLTSILGGYGTADGIARAEYLLEKAQAGS